MKLGPISSSIGPFSQGVSEAKSAFNTHSLVMIVNLMEKRALRIDV